jgi:GTP-binding protein HflX
MTDKMRAEQNRAKTQMTPEEFLAPLPERPESSEFNPIPNRSYFSNDA